MSHHVSCIFPVGKWKWRKWWKMITFDVCLFSDFCRGSIIIDDPWVPQFPIRSLILKSCHQIVPATMGPPLGEMPHPQRSSGSDQSRSHLRSRIKYQQITLRLHKSLLYIQSVFKGQWTSTHWERSTNKAILTILSLSLSTQEPKFKSPLSLSARINYFISPFTNQYVLCFESLAAAGCR